jgi:acetyl esterase/lipase
LYPAVDAADKVSCRPDFAVALYPGHLWIADKKFELNPDIPVTHQTPPTFLLQAENDPVDSVNNSLVYYIALRRAGVPVEMHLYAQGGHVVWSPPHRVSDNRMATVRGDVAGDDWDDFGVGALGLHTTTGFGASEPRSCRMTGNTEVIPSCPS